MSVAEERQHQSSKQFHSNFSMQDKNVGNRFQFSFQDVTNEDLISGVFDNLFRENEEFLVAFDVCRDDI